MHPVTIAAFEEELEKIALHSAAEVIGLGTLAAPTIQKMRGKPMSERGTHAAELGGLGILAAPSIHTMYSKAKGAVQGAAKGGKLRAAFGALKHASVNEDFQKEAFLKQLFSAVKGKAAPAAASTFKPSFAGHTKSLGVGTNIAKSGVQTTKAFDPMAQSFSKSRSLSIPGLTQ